MGCVVTLVEVGQGTGGLSDSTNGVRGLEVVAMGRDPFLVWIDEETAPIKENRPGVEETLTR